jgi:hypothetical protein
MSAEFGVRTAELPQVDAAPNIESRAVHLLDLALFQILTFIKDSGTGELEKLVEGKSEGYAQLVWAAEKLSKCALEWQEYRAPKSKAKNEPESTAAPGASPETMEHFQQFLIGLS